MPGLKKRRSQRQDGVVRGRTLCVERGRDAPREPGCRRGPASGCSRSPVRGPAAGPRGPRVEAPWPCPERPRRGALSLAGPAPCALEGPVPCAPPHRCRAARCDAPQHTLGQSGAYAGRSRNGDARRRTERVSGDGDRERARTGLGAVARRVYSFIVDEINALLGSSAPG